MVRPCKLQRKNPPHVPQRTQRHHLHHRRTHHLRKLHRPNRMPRIRPRIPPSRHARSMGRPHQQTTSKRTKTTRHQTQTTNTLPNVGRLTNPHPTRITKRERPHRTLHTITHLKPTRLQHRLPQQITPQHLLRTRRTHPIPQPRHTLTPPTKILHSQQHQLRQRTPQTLRLPQHSVLPRPPHPNRHIIQTIRIRRPRRPTPHNPSPPTNGNTP